MEIHHSRANGGSSRRDFLKRTGATIAGIPLVARSAMAGSVSRKKVRIGVVGGGFGRSFQWHEHPEFVV